MEEKLEPAVRSDDMGKTEKIEELNKRLQETRDELQELLDTHSDYARGLLKFGLASWVFALSLFVSFLLIYYGPSIIFHSPPLSISLLIGALATTFVVSAGFLANKRRKINKLKEKREKFEDKYHKNLLEVKWKRARERKEFLNTLLRHDLRNKAQTVLGYLELMDELDLPEEGDEYLDKARKGIDDSVDLIEKVRTLGEVEDEEISEVSVEDAIRNAVDGVSHAADDKGVEIEMVFPIEESKVKGGSLLDRVFSNIIENAVQYSGGSQVRVRARSTEEEIICTIEDDGKGIADENKSKIFDKGYTVAEERGTGLGMFLVKTLLEIYGGDIEVNDSELGGARFDVHLKKA